MIKKSWFISFFIACIACAILTLYLAFIQGNFNVYALNKTIAGTAAVIAGLALLVSYAAAHGLFTFYPDLRRTLGLSALLLAILHLFLSIIVLQKSFSLQWMIKEKYSIMAGAAAFLIWLYLAWLSRPLDSVDNNLRWRLIQRWGGRISFIFIYLHVIILKYPSWIHWLRGASIAGHTQARPHLPPSSLVIFIAMSLVIFLLVCNAIKPSTKIIKRTQ